MKYNVFGGLLKIPVSGTSKRKIFKGVVKAHMDAFLEKEVFPSWENYEAFPKHQENIRKYSLTQEDIAIIKDYWNERLLAKMEEASKLLHAFERYSDKNDDIHQLLQLWKKDRDVKEFLKKAHDAYKQL
ncbi:hypothetical protein FZW96_00035 [Bacillus sp. BGMRC 2118]|nr:hypothetical protein FZW96_00035 [Bacillus sp. BGMRC 2118]